MARAQYIGVAGVARRVVNQHIGVDGVARTVKRGYIGVSGAARQYYPTPPEMAFSLVEGDSRMDMENSYAGIYTDKYGDTYILLEVAASLSDNTGNRACANLDMDHAGAYAGDQLSLWYKWEVDINWCDAVVRFYGPTGQQIQSVNLPDRYSEDEAWSCTVPAGTTRIRVANTLGKEGSGWTVTLEIYKIQIGNDVIFGG